MLPTLLAKEILGKMKRYWRSLSWSKKSPLWACQFALDVKGDLTEEKVLLCLKEKLLQAETRQKPCCRMSEAVIAITAGYWLLHALSVDKWKAMCDMDGPVDLTAHEPGKCPAETASCVPAEGEERESEAKP